MFVDFSQPTLLPTTPLILLGHLPLSFRTSRISYSPFLSSRLALLSRPGTPSLLIQDGSTTSSSNRGSSSLWRDEYSGRISALTNTTIFESDESTPAGDDGPASVKEPESGERRTPSIESILSTMQSGMRVVTPPPSSVIRQPDDTIEEADERGRDEETLEQVPSDPELPDLTLGISDSPSHVLDQHPDYDSAYDSSDEENETISDFFGGRDPDNWVDDAVSTSQSISISEVQVSVPPDRANDFSSSTRPPSVASWPRSSVRFRAPSVTSSSSISSIRFRRMGSSASLGQATVPPGVYERQEQVNFGPSTSCNNRAVPFRGVTFAEPASVPPPPLPRPDKAVAWWKTSQLNKRPECSYLCPSRQRNPESMNPDAPSQPISPRATPIATLENMEAHSPLSPSSAKPTARSVRHRRTRFNFRRVVSAILPCIPISQEPDESSEAESPKERLRFKGIFSGPLGRWRKTNNDTIPNFQNMAKVETVQVRVDRRVVVE